MWIGLLMGLMACALWGITYIVPLVLPTYDPLYIALARAMVMGAVSWLALGLMKAESGTLHLSDWWFATKLSVVGNLLQCWFLMLSVQYAGAVVAGVCFGLVPVSVALVANVRDRQLGRAFVPMKKLAWPLLCLVLGLIIANGAELLIAIDQGGNEFRFFLGIGFGLLSTAMWTWYPIRNADWLLEHPQVSPLLWTSVQCAILLPLGSLLYGIVYRTYAPMEGLLGEDPLVFSGWMLFVGIACSWGATALWNAMSQRVPTSLVGQMLVFETLFAVVDTHLFEARCPTVSLVLGLGLMIVGLSMSLHIFEQHASVKKSA